MARRLILALAVFAVVMASFVLTASSANATIIITPTSGTSTTSHDTKRPIGDAFDGVLLSAGGTSGDILSETVSYAGTDGHWLSASSAVDDDANFRSTTEILTFDLGGTHDVDTIHIWPYVRAERARGVKTFDIAFSTDGGLTYPTTIAAAAIGDFTIGPSGGTAPVQSKAFAPQSDVTHIKMTHLTTFGSTGWIAISELRFSVVPEPATLALAALGLLGLRRRKRRA